MGERPVGDLGLRSTKDVRRRGIGCEAEELLGFPRGSRSMCSGEERVVFGPRRARSLKRRRTRLGIRVHVAGVHASGLDRVARLPGDLQALAAEVADEPVRRTSGRAQIAELRLPLAGGDLDCDSRPPARRAPPPRRCAPRAAPGFPPRGLSTPRRARPRAASASSASRISAIFAFGDGAAVLRQVLAEVQPHLVEKSCDDRARLDIRPTTALKFLLPRSIAHTVVPGPSGGPTCPRRSNASPCGSTAPPVVTPARPRFARSPDSSPKISPMG